VRASHELCGAAIVIHPNYAIRCSLGGILRVRAGVIVLRSCCVHAGGITNKFEDGSYSSKPQSCFDLHLKLKESLYKEMMGLMKQGRKKSPIRMEVALLLIPCLYLSTLYCYNDFNRNIEFYRKERRNEAEKSIWVENGEKNEK
jgi:hypothetical protein